jgi:hypothetical protein
MTHTGSQGKVIDILDPHFDFIDGLKEKKYQKKQTVVIDPNEVISGSNMDFSKEHM